MNFTVKEIKEKDIWDEFLEENESGHVFQSFDWGVFKKTQKWKVRRIMLQDSAGENVAALSILEKKIPLAGFKIWYLPRGPVLDFQNKELVEEVADFLIDFARKNKVMAVKISPDVVLDESTKWIPELLKNKGFKEAVDYQLHKCTVRIDLRDDLDKIFSNFKKNTRWEIRKGESIEIKVEPKKDESGLRDFYQLYSQAMGRDKLSFSYFKNLLKTLEQNISILIAYQPKDYGNHSLSAGFFAHFNHKYWYLFGGSTKKYPTLNASQVLQGDIIRRAKKDPLAKFYDLQGIPCGKPKTPHDKGVLQFKEGFGGEKVELIGEFDYVFSPILYAILRKLNQARMMIMGITGIV